MDQNTKDLVVFYSPAKARMTYYIKNASVGYMIEYPFAFITKVSQLPNKVRTKEVRPSSTPSVKSPTVLRFRIDLNQAPEFFVESPKSGGLYHCGDFDEDQQASRTLIHHLEGDAKVLSGQFAKLVWLVSFRYRPILYNLNRHQTVRDVRTSPQQQANETQVHLQQAGSHTIEGHTRTGVLDTDREMWDFLPGFEHLRHQQNTSYPTLPGQEMYQNFMSGAPGLLQRGNVGTKI